MEAIETLMNEHRLIERGIDALIAFTDEVCRKNADARDELARFVTFIKDFADGCHHGKEEHILFSSMVEAGFPSDGGPIAVMLMEHEEGRALVGELSELARQEEPWSADDRQRLANAAHGYGNLLRQHIHKEDAILYPMAEQRLPPNIQDRISAECESFEVHKAESGEHERLHRLADELIARHAPLQRTGDDPRVSGGHHCC